MVMFNENIVFLFGRVSLLSALLSGELFNRD